MDKKIKIVTIGGGSSYTPELVEGFIKRKDQLPIKELWLVDIEEGKEKLEIVGAMAQRMVKAAGLDWEVHLSLDCREALKDADFVSTQFRVGQLEARIKDERIPLSHGAMGQETNGAGGMFKAFRTIPVILDIVEDMKALCPDAWLVNFTNPAGMVTEAVIRYGNWDKVVGLCNVQIMCRKIAAGGLDAEEEALTFKFAGLNHFHWHKVWDKDGVEQTDYILDTVYGTEDGLQKAMANVMKHLVKDETQPSSEAMNDSGVKNIPMINFLRDQATDLDGIPCMYHRYYYLTSDMLAEELAAFKEGKTRAEEVKRTEARLFELYKDPNLDYKPEELGQRGGTYYSDAACELIAAIHNDSKVEMVVSTINNGAVPDLPADTVVEVNAIIRSSGPQAISWGHFPDAQRGELQLMKAMELTTIEAAVTGDYGKALQAFTINPLVPSGSVAKTILDEMLVAHKAYLPQFADKIKEIEGEV